MVKPWFYGKTIPSYTVVNHTLFLGRVMWFLSQLFTEGLLHQKVFKQIRPPLIGSTAVTSHAAVTNDAHSI